MPPVRPDITRERAPGLPLIDEIDREIATLDKSSIGSALTTGTDRW
jgi:hypothetical protein